MKIAFDVDGTLIHLTDDMPRRDVVDMLITLSTNGNEITVWSGGGKDYARVWVKRLFLDRYVTHIMEKPMHAAREGISTGIDVCFDDETVELATVNIKL